MSQQNAVLLSHILGVDVGESTGQPGAAMAQFQRMCQQVARMHEFFGELDDASCKCILLHSCAGVCKVTYLLRSVGPDISQEALVGFDSGRF